MTTSLGRRDLLAGAAALVSAPVFGPRGAVRDAADRSLQVSASVGRVFPAGPPAAILIY